MSTITGRVVAKESGIPIPNLTVRIIEKAATAAKDVVVTKVPPIVKAATDQSLASVLTMADGSFKLTINQTGKTADQSVTVYLQVEAPEDVASKLSKAAAAKEIYTSKPFLLSGEKTESFFIRIPEEVLNDLQFNLHSSASDDITSAAKINKEKFSQIKSIATAIEQKAAAGFANFQPSVMMKDQNFFDPKNKQQPLEHIQSRIIDKGLASIPASKASKTIRVRVNKDRLRRIGLPENAPGAAQVNIYDATTVLFPAPALDSAKRKCFKKITEEDIISNAPVTPPPTNGTVTSSTNGQEITHTQLMQFANRLMSTATSPEAALEYNNMVDPAYKAAKVCDTLNRLSICGGPADVTSFHDFKTVQIAFEHIWTAMFDEDLKNLGKQLYAEIVKFEEGYSATRTATAQPVVTPVANPPGVVVAAPAGGGTVPVYVSPAGGGGGPIIVGAPAGGQSTVVVSSSSVPLVPSLPQSINTINDLREFVNQFRVSGINLPPYINELVNQLDKKMSEAHTFQVFAPGSINYGLLYTFRQKWEPANYQVGRLISSLPLAPKESKKYTVKSVRVASRNQKMLDDQEYKSHSESSMTSRAEMEIVNRAQNKTSFSLSATASYNAGAFGAQMQTQLGTEAENLSSETKKNFRESVMKASQDFRKQNRTELEISGKTEYETTSANEISNPNDEIPVTYLFYELQRQYDISEELYKIQPVIFVANEVPMPNEIDFKWLITNGWILQKVILDPMYLPALYHLNESALSGTITLQLLKDNLTRQIQLVQVLTAEVSQKNAQVQASFNQLLRIIRREDTKDMSPDQISNATNALVAVLNPIGAIISAVAENSAREDQMKRMREAADMTLERQEKDKNEYAERLKNEVGALERMTNQYVEELKRVMDREHAVTQLRIHIKENILYYMQAIWDHEPPDQRFFRLYNLEIDWLEPAEEMTEARAEAESGSASSYYVQLNMNYRFKRVKRRLVEVADLDNLLGYKGNYMIFAAKKRSHLHNYMMHDFIDEYSGGLKDPDEYAQYSTQELIDFLRCLRQNSPREYEAEKDKIIEVMNEKLKLPRKEKERIIIPTNSAYIEALPGKHPVLEDFKLVHRALDVKKVQAEVRRMELENLRYASRLSKDQLEDPDFEKQVLIRKGDEDIDISDV